jgi:hypothetical protein
MHADAASAALTIANRAPANQADLLALTLYHLHDLERHLRGSDTFALRQFWKEGRGGVDTPKDENACRDLILDALRIRLAPLGISAIPERRAADDKRSDLRLEFIGSGRPLTTPVEIKKDNNVGVWNAWRTQLQGLYAIDPTADGHGVYLVLWFGRKALRSPEGEIADSRQALTHLLTQRIPVQDRVRLRVFVMDLSLKPKSKRNPKVQK